jgi:hypothetical protein
MRTLFAGAGVSDGVHRDLHHAAGDSVLQAPQRWGGCTHKLSNSALTHIAYKRLVSTLKAPGFTTLKAPGFTTLKSPGFTTLKAPGFTTLEPITS